jgi:hypothetical protein
MDIRVFALPVPVVRVRYELAESEDAELAGLLDSFLETRLPRR